MNKKPQDASHIFQKFRALSPPLIFFFTIFYFLILMETRIDNERRFNGNGNGKNGRNGKNANGKNGFLNGIKNGTKAQ